MSKSRDSPPPTPEMEFGPDSDIDMEELEEIRAMLGPDAPDIEDWDAVQDVTNGSSD
ncbi:hypothetical protein FRC12_024888 [Ceratobasidium sp. 428]|nr:hypothetical protein FRC12_024888 [Ceratobasidium sp. 428]